MTFHTARIRKGGVRSIDVISVLYHGRCGAIRLSELVLTGPGDFSMVRIPNNDGFLQTLDVTWPWHAMAKLLLFRSWKA